MTSLLTTTGLRLRVGRRNLLDGLDWQVQAGQFWCVLGKNGVGKSSLLHTVAGLLPAAAGRIDTSSGDIVVATPTQLAQWRGLVMQQQADAFSCSVLDSVMAGRHPHGNGWSWPMAAELQLAREVLQDLGMAAYVDADVLTLSGGERQRVAIATLMLQAPQLYLLDEPVSHQDVAAQFAVMRRLRGLADAQHAVVASMHDVNLAMQFATHVLLLGEQSHWSGTVVEVLQPALLEAAFSCRFELIRSQRGNWLVAAPDDLAATI